ncbi:Y-family DNA polymerase [Mesomycoplasma hyopneumoniae]|uniref:Y-family DNA polymerase n=1 Tax=Mesomycoplasma hyopneumoniae TaxID=2099 RepID=UPI0038571EFF
MLKIIAHIDIDNFFVSSELKLNPKLKGQPIVISRSEDFAMAVSVSKEVKSKGFKISDKINEIKKKIPNLLVIHPNINYYKFLSDQFFNFISKNFSKKIEVYSIDECFIDLTEYSRKFKSITDMLYFIKNKLVKNFRLPISIGLSYNKLLAKMATNLAKNSEAGIMQVSTKKDVKAFIYPQKIGNLFGIGIQNTEKLKKFGIITIQDFIQKGVNNEKIIEILGVNRYYFFHSLTKIGDDNVCDKLEKFKSVSHFRTLSGDILLTKKQILDGVSEFLLELVEKLKKFNKAANRVEFFFKLKNKEKDHFFSDISFPSNDYDFLYQNLLALVKKIENFSLIHGFGITLSKISDYDRSMLNTNPKVKNIVAKVNKKIGLKKLFVLKYLKN